MMELWGWRGTGDEVPEVVATAQDDDGLLERTDDDDLVYVVLKDRTKVEGVRPRIIKQVEPVYPEMARRARVQGLLFLEAVIKKDGTVGEVEVRRGRGKTGCNEAAIAALKQWEFEPGYVGGRPVDALMIMTIRFQLK